MNNRCPVKFQAWHFQMLKIQILYGQKMQTAPLMQFFLLPVSSASTIRWKIKEKREKNEKQVSNLTIEKDSASTSILVKVQEETYDICLILYLILALLSKTMTIIEANITELPKCKVFEKKTKKNELILNNFNT